MKIKQMFKKPIDREIEGVIKADDLENLKTEVEEYVITNEIARNLSTLADQYNRPNHSNNGVWISGFFGSGKSHLLKMLALFLEKRQINGLDVVETLLSKIPSTDALLKAELKKAVAIPSKSILFHIDVKADAINMSESDRVLGVFAKVFDDFCGYFGQQGYIAKFERDLDHQGLLQKFKDTFQEISGLSWHEGRELFNSNRQYIAKAYARLTGNPDNSALDIVQSYRADYHLSIGDFAKNVNNYIEKQEEKGFRLNFFVDEVGAFVAENLRMMNNLQSLAESLATECKGRAWLFVTSQEDLSTVLGDIGAKQGNDFSRILDRFKCHMHLSSQDVAEVIQKRLLTKTVEGALDLKKRYALEHQNFGTLFTFPDGGMTLGNINDEESFVNSYPFIPYQYTLFQQSIEALSRHNAFTGRHNSVGERSMLGVFQDVVKTIGDKETGTLGSYDQMFEGLRSTLKSGNLRPILNAENNLGNAFAIKLLKALFMVKYVKSFKSTPRNLRVLMQAHLDEDIKDLEARINEALSLLEKEIFIQRNDDIYEYLTEEEQDIEAEIKNVPVDNEEILKTMDDLFFADVIKDNKIEYAENEEDYSFAKYIDEKLRGRVHELSIDFITPFSEFNDNLVALKAHSMGKAELMVVMPPDPQFTSDLLMFKRTESYIKQNHGMNSNETRNTILSNKAYQNTDRRKSISGRVNELLARAKFIVSGDEVEISGEDARTKIYKAFNLLIARVYPNLRMLGKIKYSETDIRRYLESGNSGLFNQEALPLNEAELEMVTFIRNIRSSGERTTMKRIEERFSSKPYGWPLAAIQCIAAMLAGRGQIECWLDGTQLDNGPLEKALKNTYGFGNLILDPRLEIDPQKIHILKNFYGDFFNNPSAESDARAIVKAIKAGLSELVNKLNNHYALRDRYPFMTMLKPVTDRLNAVLAQDFNYFISEDARAEFSELLDLKESAIDPIIAFAGGQKREIYDELAAFVLQKKPDLPIEELEKLATYLHDPKIHIGNQLQAARVDLFDIKTRMEKRLECEREKALQNVADLQTQMHQMQDFKGLSPDHQKQLDKSFDQVVYTIRQQSLAVSIRDMAVNYEVNDYPALLTTMSQMAAPEPGDSREDDKKVKAKTFIHARQVEVSFDRKVLENEDDVRAYCQALEKAMLEAIRNDKRINL